jgi:hypothetical protein
VLTKKIPPQGDAGQANAIGHCNHRQHDQQAANVGGVATHRQRYSSSMISVALPNVAAEKEEDPAVDRSHSGKEGGGVKDNDDKYHKGGREEAGAPPSRRRPLLL